MRARPRPIAGRRVWLIGASSGIGAALARELRRRGARLAVTARRADQLDEVAGRDMAVVPADVTDRRAVLAAARVVEDALGGVDTVVWCAGFWKRLDAADWDADAFARHVEVNLLGLNNVLAATLPGLVRRGDGHLVGVASVAGYRGLPGSEAYGATKAAQLNLFEALRAALRGRGIRVTTVSPGFVRTPMTAANTFPMPFMIEADAAARAVADGLERGRTEIVFPLPVALGMRLARLLPSRLWTALASRGSRAGGPRAGGAPAGGTPAGGAPAGGTPAGGTRTGERRPDRGSER
ncbi:MAG: SDR family NAD(P)-dependent oxidoreductase [Actinomycetales bacterium]|nr:SDR family NAD(P)-dependent oxidoreductase [Actinomycetales bacterium]